MAQMRNLRPSDAREIGVCNVDGGPIMDIHLLDRALWGSYRIVGEFQRELTRRVHLEHVKEETYPGLKELLEFQATHKDSSVTFTHGDLSSFNILAEGDQVTGIINWETAGWLP